MATVKEQWRTNALRIVQEHRAFLDALNVDTTEEVLGVALRAALKRNDRRSQ